jgi:Leucine-rich repeat (LRR) protein
LDLSGCANLEELAEDFGQSVPKLKRLDMTFCVSLRRLPESIGHLTDLEHLVLGYSGGLRTLPDSVVGLVSLRTLVLPSCPDLQQLPEELGTLTNLETLSVSGCNSLSALPASIGGLRMLRKLVVDSTKVRDLPAELGLLSSLTSLRLRGLGSFPETLQGLQSLTLLRARSGSMDMVDLGALAALRKLDLSYHATITTLPQTIGNLKWLVSLSMEGCPELSTVEVLPSSLEQLNLSDCPKLAKIPSLATTSCLLRLNLHNCRSLRHIHGLECLTTLEDMDVSGCTSIEDCRLHRTKNNALRKCDVKGSKVSVGYNNRWLEVNESPSFSFWLVFMAMAFAAWFWKVVQRCVKIGCCRGNLLYR